ncbi:hypothetical protein ACIRJR_15400 [Streptomyces sp. NPDC102402]|uniref:hypothetical protein n=1 Tax=Streptomyces sp. NPDC102402 TaxID=3366169 RepID=UPI0038148AD7
MHSLKLWLDRSLPAQAVLVLVVGVGVGALFRRDEHPVIWVIHGAVYAAVTLGILVFHRRRAGRAAGTDARGVAGLTRRVRHREVPTDPEERETMRRLVDDQLGTMERAGRWLPYWLGLMGLVAVGVLTLGIIGGSLLLPLAFAVATAGFCFWILWMRRRTLGAYRHMRSALKSQA